jgi:hypothetical protein
MEALPAKPSVRADGPSPAQIWVNTGIAIAAVLVAITALVGPWLANRWDKAHPPTSTIDTPSATVTQYEVVSGQLRNVSVSGDEQLWVAVRSVSTGRFYPGSMAVMCTGSLTHWYALIQFGRSPVPGHPNDIGAKYTVLVYLLNAPEFLALKDDQLSGTNSLGTDSLFSPGENPQLLVFRTATRLNIKGPLRTADQVCASSG